MAAITHFFDNSLGGSAHGIAKGGLTELGRKVVAEMVRLNMLIDVAHNSHAAIAEIVAAVNNVREICQNLFRFNIA
jgi:membrane dipeptidase